MGTILKGILGGFSGKVGTVVGSTWKGKAVMRSLPGPRTGESTQAQAEQQAKFALMIKFLKPLNPLLEQTYKKVATGMSGLNKAMSFNVLNAITGVYPDYTVDYAAVLISRGDLPNAIAPAAASPSAGQLAFSWTDNSGSGKALATDKAFMAVYCETLNQWVFLTDTAARNAGAYTLDATAFSSQAVQTWLGFISENGKFIADSLFAGQVNVL